MKKKFLILIEDDFEIMGNGLGNVAELQYLPALAFMNIAAKHHANLTFMVEVAHQLALEKNVGKSEIRIQKNLWDETVLLMKERGFDVQLHLHAQWINASYRDGFFFIDGSWNIGCRNPAEQNLLIAESVAYLKDLLQPNYPDYHVCAFKAGSWGLQPSSNLLTQLRNNGISIILGVVNDLKIPGASINYTGLEEKYLPYHPDIDDITKVSTEDTSLVVLPLQPYAPDVFTLTKFILDRTINLLRRKNIMEYYYGTPIPDEILKFPPLTNNSNIKLSIHPYQTHLKIGNQPFSFLQASFDATINRLRRFDIERIPVIIECHSKQFINYYAHIDRFIGYIAEKYESEAEFGTLSSYFKEMEENPKLVRSKK
jgi:hypothetical protein